jgi:hypothetical protein
MNPNFILDLETENAKKRRRIPYKSYDNYMIANKYKLLNEMALKSEPVREIQRSEQDSIIRINGKTPRSNSNIKVVSASKSILDEKKEVPNSDRQINSRVSHQAENLTNSRKSILKNSSTTSMNKNEPANLNHSSDFHVPKERESRQKLILSVNTSRASLNEQEPKVQNFPLDKLETYQEFTFVDRDLNKVPDSNIIVFNKNEHEAEEEVVRCK